MLRMRLSNEFHRYLLFFRFCLSLSPSRSLSCCRFYCFTLRFWFLMVVVCAVVKMSKRKCVFPFSFQWNENHAVIYAKKKTPVLGLMVLVLVLVGVALCIVDHFMKYVIVFSYIAHVFQMFGILNFKIIGSFNTQHALWKYAKWINNRFNKGNQRDFRNQNVHYQPIWLWIALNKQNNGSMLNVNKRTYGYERPQSYSCTNCIV